MVKLGHGKVNILINLQKMMMTKFIEIHSTSPRKWIKISKI